MILLVHFFLHLYSRFLFLRSLVLTFDGDALLMLQLFLQALYLSVLLVKGVPALLQCSDFHL